jgi:hypothetical protein
MPECHYGTIKEWIVDNLWNKHKEKITCKNLDQYRYSLINGTLNNVSTLQPCVRQTNEILLYKSLKSAQPLRNILRI